MKLKISGKHEVTSLIADQKTLIFFAITAPRHVIPLPKPLYLNANLTFQWRNPLSQTRNWRPNHVCITNKNASQKQQFYTTLVLYQFSGGWGSMTNNNGFWIG
jgi:hypothetical protein